VQPSPAPRLVRRPLGWSLAPEEVLRLVRSDAHPIALMGAWAGGSDVIGSEPTMIRHPPWPLSDVIDSPFQLGAPPGDRHGDGQGLPPGAGSGDGEAFGGGWIGCLGFGLAAEVLPIPPAPGGPRTLSAWWFGYYDHVLRRDRATDAWFFEALWTPDRAEALERRFDDLTRRSRGPAPEPRGYACDDFRLVPSAADHKAAVARAVDYIGRGDIFQANICLRLEADFAGDPLDAFCHSVSALRPPYAAFIRVPGGAVASMSPELFLRRTGRTVLSRPIKGTRPRSPRQDQAQRQRAELERSAKDRAENVMIVDLMRNDLSRVCVPGSVEVPRLLHAEPHPGLWHLVSDVRGTLDHSAGDGDLVRATFPPGSVTGAPKVRALEVIHELEATPREIYTGAIGYRSPLAGLELNVAIRTFEFHGGRVWLGSGGGIVADSDAGQEYEECLAKAGPLVRAIGGRLSQTPAAATGGRRTPADAAITAATLRPRPAAGVFTSLAVADGVTHSLAEHLTRLEGSVRELFGKGLPPALDGELAACVTEKPSGRLRITVRPAGGPLRSIVEVLPVDRPPADVRLRPAEIAGGLGAHKWLDRRLLAELARSAALEPDEQLLIGDVNGELLETDRANLFAVIGGVLHTPPADGRLLPGVTRNAVLRAASDAGLGVSVTSMTIPRLLAASEVFVTNAFFGIRSVRSLAGYAARWQAGPVTARIMEALPGQSADRSRGAAAPPEVRRPATPLVRPARPARPARGTRPLTVLIDNYDSFSYNLAHLLMASGCTVEVVRNDDVTAEEVAAVGADGVVISPGPCTPADAGISVDVVRAISGQTPLLGVCLGHQAIAAAFGARIVPAPRPVHGKTSAVQHDGRGFLAGLPQGFEATRYHSLIVAEKTLPACVEVTARAEGHLPMGIRHRVHLTEGVQFHPESILTTCGETIIENFVKAAREARREETAGVRGRLSRPSRRAS
jgi:para-aminobenzoate synthetase / 4-amino-4-deoxychorismate lyase